MKKLLACILTTVLALFCFTACNVFDGIFGKKSGVNKEYYENCAVFTFDDFESKISIELERTVRCEGTIYYQINLEEGALSINYKDTGLIHNMQPLGDFTADDQMPIKGSAGYIEGDEITIQFEALSSVNGEIIIAFTKDALNTVHGNLQPHKHTGEWHASETSHYYQYTCGCPSAAIAELHADYDDNNICDVCGYAMCSDDPVPTNYFLRNQAGCEWLNEISVDDIEKIKIIEKTVGIAPGNLKTILSSSDTDVIARIFDDYYWLDTWPISKMEGQIYGGGAVTVKFILKDGTEKALYINNGNYLDTNGNYFELLYTPNFMEGDNATKVYGFITYIDTGVVYQYDYPDLGEKICDIAGIGELEFIPYVWSAENLPSHIIETEFGMLKIYDFAVFTYNGDAYLVTDDSFNFYNFFTK